MSESPNHKLYTFEDSKGEFATLEVFNGADSASKPFILLCGWTGSAMRMMKGYRAWYRAQNYHVATLPTRFHFGLTSSVYSLERLKREMDPLLDGIAQHLPRVFDAQSPLKTIIHVFSNGGSHTLYHVLSNLDERGAKSGNPVKIRDPVLLTMDSAPNFPTNPAEDRSTLSWASIKGYGRFITPNLGWKQTDFNEFLATCIAAVVLPVYYFGKPVLRVIAPGYVGDFSSEVRKALTHADLDKANRLFLFGEGDRMVPAKGIRIFRDEEIARLGAGKIEAQEFDRSDHVQHGMMHYNDYWTKVAETLRKMGIEVPNPTFGFKQLKAKL